MDMIINQQVALDEALVPHASRLRIGKSNFRLRSDITSKESTLQLVYDILRLTPFYKAFLVTADVKEIYIKQLWATATVHHYSISFKMDNMKRIVILEYFREMLHICPRLIGQTFDELPFEEEILAFLGHSGEIRKLTNVNINKLHQPRRSFAAVINKRLSGKVHATIVFDYLMLKFFGFGVMLPIELTNEAIRNYEAYKEYYAVASGAAPPKTKASLRKTKSSSDTTITPPTAAGTRLSSFAKGKQPAKASKAKYNDDDVDERSDDQDDDDDDQDDDDQDEGDDDEQDEGNDDDQDTNDKGDEFIHPKLTIHEEEETKDEESFDPIVQTPENSNDEGNDDVSLGLNVGSEEGQDTEDDKDELYREININLAERDMDIPALTTVASLTLTTLTLTPPTIPTISRVPQAPTPPTTAPSTLLQDLLNFGSLASPGAGQADLSEMELKKILIENIESNKFIHRSDEQRNLYKALVEAYESDKIILHTYGDTVTLKRRRDDAYKDEKPSAGSDRGSKRRRERKEPESTSALKEKETKTTGKST
nr:hypothetical protein [Tanacetum cinerariifolium]